MKGIEYLNNEFGQKLDRYEKICDSDSSNPVVRAEVVSLLVELNTLSGLYEFGEMPVIYMARWHGIKVKVLRECMERM